MGELPGIVRSLIPEPCPPTFPVRMLGRTIYCLPVGLSVFTAECVSAVFQLQLFFQDRPSATEGCVDLLSGMFSFSPRQRWSASTALQHHYFSDAQPKALSATSLAVELEPLLRRGGAESSSDEEAAAGEGGEREGGGDFSGLRRGPLFSFGSGDSVGSAASSGGRGALCRQPLFGSADSGASGFGSGARSSAHSSGSSMTMDGVGASGHMSGESRIGSGRFGSGATRALFESDDDLDPDL